MFFVLFLMPYEDTNPVISQKCRVLYSSDVLRIFILVGRSGVPYDPLDSVFYSIVADSDGIVSDGWERG
jgi:hypothetical protein